MTSFVNKTTDCARKLHCGQQNCLETHYLGPDVRASFVAVPLARGFPFHSAALPAASQSAPFSTALLANRPALLTTHSSLDFGAPCTCATWPLASPSEGLFYRAPPYKCTGGALRPAFNSRSKVAQAMHVRNSASGCGSKWPVSGCTACQANLLRAGGRKEASNYRAGAPGATSLPERAATSCWSPQHQLPPTGHRAQGSSLSCAHTAWPTCLPRPAGVALQASSKMPDKQARPAGLSFCPRNAQFGHPRQAIHTGVGGCGEMPLVLKRSSTGSLTHSVARTHARQD